MKSRLMNVHKKSVYLVCSLCFCLLLFIMISLVNHVDVGGKDGNIQVSESRQVIIGIDKNDEIENQIALKVKQILVNKGYDVKLIDKENLNSLLIDADLILTIAYTQDKKNDVSGIVIEYSNISENHELLAGLVQDYTALSTYAKNLGIKENVDLLDMNIPTCLVRFKYITDEELLLLQAEDYQEKIAEGLSSGIEAYFKEMNNII